MCVSAVYTPGWTTDSHVAIVTVAGLIGAGRDDELAGLLRDGDGGVKRTRRLGQAAEIPERWVGVGARREVVREWRRG